MKYELTDIDWQKLNNVFAQNEKIKQVKSINDIWQKY